MQGCSKVVNFQTSVRCQTCSKSSLHHDDRMFTSSPHYAGTGFFCSLHNDISHDTFASFFYSCSCFADGSGLPPGVQPQPCKQCKGRGRVSSYILITNLS